VRLRPSSLLALDGAVRRRFSAGGAPTWLAGTIERYDPGGTIKQHERLTKTNFC